MTGAIDGEGARRLGLLVDSLEQPAFAPRLHELLASLLIYDNLAVLAFSPDRPPVSLHGVFADRRTERYYRQHYFLRSYCLDPFYQGCLAGLPAGLYRLRDIAPDRFFQSEYHKAYYRFVGLADEIGFLAPLGERTWLHLSLSRLNGAAPFGAGEVRRLAGYEPLLTALIRRHWAGAASADASPADGGLVGHILALSGVAQRALTRREAEVTAQVLGGHSSTAIGLRLGISPDTVKVHRRRIYRKLAISSQAELFARFIPFNGRGLVNAPDKRL